MTSLFYGSVERIFQVVLDKKHRFEFKDGGFGFGWPRCLRMLSGCQKIFNACPVYVRFENRWTWNKTSERIVIAICKICATLSWAMSSLSRCWFELACQIWSSVYVTLWENAWEPGRCDDPTEYGFIVKKLIFYCHFSPNHSPCKLRSKCYETIAFIYILKHFDLLIDGQTG